MIPSKKPNLDLQHSRHDRRVAIRYLLLYPLIVGPGGSNECNLNIAIQDEVVNVIKAGDVFFTSLLSTSLHLPPPIREAINAKGGSAKSSHYTSVDSSLKKNLGFVKRLKAGDVTSAIKELGKLKLDPYLSEIVSATIESLTSLAPPVVAHSTDVSADSTISDAVTSSSQASAFSSSRKIYSEWLEIIVLFHARFGMSFTHPFITQLYQALTDNKNAVLPIPLWPPQASNFLDSWDHDVKSIPGLTKKGASSSINSLEQPSASAIKSLLQSQKVLMRVWVELWAIGILDVYAWMRAKLGTFKQPVIGRTEDMGLGGSDTGATDAPHADPSFMKWDSGVDNLQVASARGSQSFLKSDDRSTWWLTSVLPWQNDLLGVALRELVVTSLSGLRRIQHNISNAPQSQQAPTVLATGLGLSLTFVRHLADELGFLKLDGEQTLLEYKDAPEGERVNGRKCAADDDQHVPLVYPEALVGSTLQVLKRASSTWLRHVDYEYRHIKSLHNKHNDWYYVKGSDPPEDFKLRYERDLKLFFQYLSMLQPLVHYFNMSVEPFEIEDDGTDRILSKAWSEVGPEVGNLCKVVGGDDDDVRLNKEDKEDDIVVGTGMWDDENQRDFYERLFDRSIPDGIHDQANGVFSDGVTEAKIASPSGKNEEGTEPEAHDDPRKQLDVTLPTLTSAVAQDTADEISHVLFTCLQKLEQLQTAKKDSGKKGREDEDVSLAASIAPREGDNTRAEAKESAENEGKVLPPLTLRGGKQKIVKALAEVPKFRHDLIPFYGRICANISQHYPDIGDAVVDLLSRDFRYIRRTAKGPTDPFRSDDLAYRTVVYLGEMVKFSRCPPYVIFFCLRELLHHNTIEVTCRLLETCGRFLYTFSKTTRTHLKVWLDVLVRKKEKKLLDGRLELLIETAHQTVIGHNRGSDAAPENKMYVLDYPTVLRLFAKKLVFVDLHRKTTEKVLKLLRKLPWDGVMVPVETPDAVSPDGGDAQGIEERLDQEFVQELMHRTLLKCWKVKFSQIKLLAMLACGLAKHHPEFGVRLVDGLTEEIRADLEKNEYSRNQRRMACVKYLGEFYNYRMFDSTLVFDTLFGLITFGYPVFPPPKGRAIPSDPSFDSIRIRLACCLLETCGDCFDRGKARKRLDMFLEVLMCYVWSKIGLSRDVWYVVMDVAEYLRPKYEVPESYEAALERVTTLEAEARTSAGKEDDDDDGDQEDEDGSEEEAAGRSKRQNESDEDYENGTDISEGDVLALEDRGTEGDGTDLEDRAPYDDDDDDVPDSSDDEDDIFERALQSMTEKSLEKAIEENPLPEGTPSVEVGKNVGQEPGTGEEPDVLHDHEKENETEEGIKLRFLTRKKKDAEIVLPTYSQLAVNAKMHKIQKEREDLEFKKLVVDYEGWGTEEPEILEPHHAPLIRKDHGEIPVGDITKPDRRRMEDHSRSTRSFGRGKNAGSRR